MGAGLVGATLNAEWAVRLTHLERVVLITMAHTALDPGQVNGRPPAEYWGGIEALMITALGKLPNAGTTEYASAKRVILRALARLESAHAIERVKAGRRGQRARWKIILDVSQPVDSASSRSGKG